MKIKSMKLNKNGKPVSRIISKAQAKAKIKKALSQDFTHVVDTTVSTKPGLRRGCAHGWGVVAKQVGRRHKCLAPNCKATVPVEQEGSSFCTMKCERLFKAAQILAAAGFGRVSR